MLALWSAASPSFAQTPPAPPAPGPIPLAVDGGVTPWLQVRGEFRSRVEGFTGGGFSPGNDDSYWMSRFRFNATVTPAKRLVFFVQASDARAFDKTTGGLAAPLRDTLDLRQAYADVIGGSSVSVRIGRQELNYGETRLIGAANWLNTARTFDAGKVTFKSPLGTFDAFAASVVTIDSEGFDKSGGGNALYGTYESLTGLLPKQTFEPYLLWRQSPNVTAELGGVAPLHQATVGLRAAGKLPAAFDYSTEVAVQRGSVGADSISAWAGHAALGRTLALPWKPRVFGEFNYASGDENPKDGVRGTFDQLYPTAHDKYGLADQIGWRNIRHARGGMELRVTPKWQLSGSYHDYWLASATDGLYAASGALVARSVTGAAGTHVGREVDVQTSFVYSAQLQLAAGFAHLVPGEFLELTTGGHAYSYPFVMATYVFLGETPAVGRRQTR